MIHLLHRMVLHALWLYEYLGWLRRQVWLLRSVASPAPIDPAGGKRPRHLMLISQKHRKLQPRELRMLLRSLPALGIPKVTVRMASLADVQHALRGVAEERGEPVEAIGSQNDLFLLQRPGLSIYFEVGDANTRVLRQMLQQRHPHEQQHPKADRPDQIDLLLSTQHVLQLTGVSALCIGFAQLSHLPSGDFITEPILRAALAEYASCQQNFGK